MTLARKLRYGMVGGGPGAFIGAVHRRAAEMDGLATLVAGAFSSTAEKSRAQGAALFLDPRRVYASFDEMAEREAALPDEERIDFVSIVTPNHMHAPAARAFLERGIHVVCDKPLTTTIDDAEELCRLADARELLFAVTYNYSGYPMVKQARALVQQGVLGRIRKVVVEYSQDWLASRIEASGQKQAEWRTDPARAGISSAIGDIGSHAEHLVRYVTGLEMTQLCGELTTFVEGRALEDDASLLVRFRGGARGILFCSQISVGAENDFRLRVYGSDASIAWRQEEPNTLQLLRAGQPEQVLKRGNDYLAPAARHATRLPSGHPEAFLEAFANIYANFIRTLAARQAGKQPNALDLDFPTVRDGAAGVRFIHAAVRSGSASGWVGISADDAAQDPFVLE